MITPSPSLLGPMSVSIARLLSFIAAPCPNCSFYTVQMSLHGTLAATPRALIHSFLHPHSSDCPAACPHSLNSSTPFSSSPFTMLSTYHLIWLWVVRLRVLTMYLVHHLHK